MEVGLGIALGEGRERDGEGSWGLGEELLQDATRDAIDPFMILRSCYRLLERTSD